MMMTCREIYGFLDEFLEGSLSGMTQIRFAAHLLLCEKCRKYLATYQATIKAARGAELAEAPKELAVPEELIEAILSARRTKLEQQPE